MGTMQKTESAPLGSVTAIGSSRQGLAIAATGLIERIQVWYDRALQRRALQGLTDQQLKDIGLSRADAAREAMKQFWQE